MSPETEGEDETEGDDETADGDGSAGEGNPVTGGASNDVGDDEQDDEDDEQDGDDGDMGGHSPANDGTPILLVFGQSNAGLLYHSGTIREDLAEAGSDAIVINVAEGGTSVSQPDGEWNIVDGDGSDDGGALYDELLEAVDEAKATNPDAYVAGAIWVQGESDRTVSRDYYEPTKALLEQMQADLGAGFPVTIVGLSDAQVGGDAGREHVQDAQMKLADDLEFAHFLDLDQLIADAGLSEAEVLREDGLHYSPEFYERISEAVLDQPALRAALGLETGSHGAPGDHDGGDMDGSDDDMGDHGGGSHGAPGDHDNGDMDGSGDDMGDHGGGSHGDQSYPEAPGIGATSSEISTFLSLLAEMDETHVHDHGSELSGEHVAVMSLAPLGDASHVAIADGDWDDPQIWSTGEVPGDDATVLIPPGVTVSYGTVSDAELFTLRIDGKLEFETDSDSKMIFDTMLVAPGGHLEIGTIDDPVDPSVTIDLIVADNGPIDTDWDPMLLSRGIISHGRADIHGAVKDSHEKVSDDPMAGDTSVTFDDLPAGWQVGDTIVIAGTRYDGHKWDHDLGAVRPHDSEDEVRIISEIDGDTVHFEEALVHDHDTPRADLRTSVANYTRNVSVESENGADSEIFARGHVMFMHSDDVDVRYAEFTELGRTDKSVDAFATDNIASIEFDSNVQGRYSLHLHRTGTDDLDDPTMLQGNAVFGSPGWGIVHHDANAIIDNNATFDTFGAGYVAETGNETGAWTNNIAIYAEGAGWGNPKNHVDLGEFDTARTGDGFWFQGRLVDATDNIAASVNAGYSYFHRNGDDRMIDVESDNFAFGDALDGETSTADDVPIRVFEGNETFAANYGLIVVKANPNQGHDVWSHLNDFKAWEVRTGAHLEYTSHYVLTDFDVIGKESTPFSHPQAGISFGNNTTEMVVVDASIDGFETGVDLNKHFTNDSLDPSLHDYFVINTTITNAETDYENYDPALDTVITDAGLSSTVPVLTLDGPLTYKEGYPDPDARHVDINGTKTDALGNTQVPGGTDDFDIGYQKVINLLETDGYWSTSEGQNYFIADIFVTDRLTGDVYVEKHPVFIDESVSLGNQYSRYGDAHDNGVQDIVEMPDGTLMAGDMVLEVPELAVPFAHLRDAETSTEMQSTEMSGMEIMEMLSLDAPETSDHMMHGGADEHEMEPMLF